MIAKLTVLIQTTIQKYKKIILYCFFGALTTLLNISLYLICARALLWNTVISNSVAWVGGVIFAYVTNRIFVFDSKQNGLRVILREFGSFVTCRLVTGGLDMIIMYVCVDLAHANDLLVKVVSNIIVIVLNYVGSKVVVFRSRSVEG